MCGPPGYPSSQPRNDPSSTKLQLRSYQHSPLQQVCSATGNLNRKLEPRATDCRKPRKEAETPLTSSMPLWRREWGRLVTTTFTEPLGLVLGSRLHSPWLLRLAQRELDETNKLHTEGIQSLGSPMTPLVGSASRCTARAFLQAGA